MAAVLLITHHLAPELYLRPVVRGPLQQPLVQCAPGNNNRHPGRIPALHQVIPVPYPGPVNLPHRHRPGQRLPDPAESPLGHRPAARLFPGKHLALQHQDGQTPLPGPVRRSRTGRPAPHHNQIMHTLPSLSFSLSNPACITAVEKSNSAGCSKISLARRKKSSRLKRIRNT